jgi:molecular chaperone GrpE
VTGKSARKDAGDPADDGKASAELEAAEKKASDNLDMAMRIQADFDNYRKRIQRETEEFRKYAAETIISELLAIVDDLERALSHADANNEMTIGVNGIRNNLMKVLASKGLAEIPTERFDPNVHDALCIEYGDEDDGIAEVFQKGYKIGDRVLRYAKVRVTKKQTEEEGVQKCQG